MSIPQEPPGRIGLPLVGETPGFISNVWRFLDERRLRYGTVFKSSVLGRRIIFLAGIEGAEAFYDPENITRSDAHPYPFYRDPDRFDPDRFAPGRAEHLTHPMAFIPQGAEPPTGHRCLGLDYSTFLSVAFLALLLRGYEWDLPLQDLEYNWKTVPPEPRGGLRVRLRAAV